MELDFQIDFLKKIKISKSGSSIDVKNIVSFTLGPFTSRFWAVRKHIN